MSESKQIERKLKAPFPKEKIQWRVQQCGLSSKGTLWAIILPYITSRETMDRLDDVMGLGGWKDDVEIENSSAKCYLSLKFDGEWNTKTGWASETNIEAVKGGASDALKRAGYKFGIGRYLYELDEAHYSDQKDPLSRKRKKGWNKGTVSPKKNKQGDEYVNFYFKPPELPEWALPSKDADTPTLEQGKPKDRLTMSYIQSEIETNKELWSDVKFHDSPTDKQIQSFNIFWEENIEGNKHDRYRFLSDIVDRDIESSKDLTKGEISALQSMQKQYTKKFITLANQYVAEGTKELFEDNK